MRLLLTNDDGFDAAGLLALANAVRGLGEIHVVAPDRPWSCMSHGVTQYGEIHVTERDVPGLGRCHLVNGSPADCVRIGLSAGCIPKPDVVLSGINHGGNLGIDVFYSGTIAAVREAAILGVPAIACSQYRKNQIEIDWARASTWVRPVIQRLIDVPPTSGLYWSVNLPHPDTINGQPPVRVLPTGLAAAPVTFEESNGQDDGQQDGRRYQYSNAYQDRPIDPDSDVEHVFGGGISVTPLGLNTVVTDIPKIEFPSPAT